MDPFLGGYYEWEREPIVPVAAEGVCSDTVNVDRYTEMLRRAQREVLPLQEVDEVAEELRASRSDDAVYGRLAILGETRARQHRDLVEGSLTEGNDSFLARKALQILCVHLYYNY